MIPEEQMLLRMLIAAVLGAMIGFERERQNQPAGLRTHIILAMGATLAMMVSIDVAARWKPITGSADPARIAAQVVSGIGFLGGGAILRYGANIKGLTTATSLWTMAMVGLAVGSGLPLAALGTTLLLLITLTIINWLEKRLIRAKTTWTVTFTSADRPGLYDEFNETVISLEQKVRAISIKKDVTQNVITFDAVVETIEAENVHKLLQQLSSIPGTRDVQVREGGWVGGG